jgi:hypothetical protein
MFEIRNYYEQMVQDYLWERMTNESKPPEHGFLEDVACLALNHLPPRYVRHSVDLGSHLSDTEYARMQGQVRDAVEEAIERVRRRPRHRE